MVVGAALLVVRLRDGTLMNLKKLKVHVLLLRGLHNKKKLVLLLLVGIGVWLAILILLLLL